MSAQLLRHREKVLASAEQQLEAQGRLDTPELITLYKKFLKIEEHRVQLQHKSGGGGRQICGLRASLIDIVLRHLLRLALPEAGQNKTPPLAIVALGGYGRAELNPCSDVDIMFLVADSSRNLPKVLNDAIQRIYYILLDSGLKVGDHSTRTVNEAIKQANADMVNKTTMLEARLVAGDATIFDQFRERYLRLCVEPHVDAYIAARVANQAERHEKNGRSIYMQEPNVKSGCGGLRDYQNLLWMAFFKFRVQGTAGLVEKKFCNEPERRQLEKAYDFLLRTRTELHYLNGRAADVIVLSQQLPVATRLGYPQKNILRRSEAFMRDYYQHARNIYHFTSVMSERMALQTPDPNAKRGLLGLLRRSRPQIERFDGFYSSEGLMFHETREIFTQDHARLMRLFQHLQQRDLRMSAELQHLVRRRLHLVDKTFCYAKDIRETFAAICSRKGSVGRILRAMHEVDFLGRYIPEFGQLTCLVQHEFFHRYTADEHTLVCIEKLDHVLDESSAKLAEYRKLFHKLEDPYVLYLALLLHDTGKASNARQHAEASAVFSARVARRLQLGPEQRKSLVLLVDNHIVMSMSAQRRNLDDPATISEFAAVVKTQPNLDMLMLLTLADGQGTGDETWSDWKEMLVWQLYRSTSLYLADGEAYYRQRSIEREGLRKAVEKTLPADFADEIDAHFEFMPDRYFQTHVAASVVEHMRLFREFLARCANSDTSPLIPATRWVPRTNQGHTEMWICGWDRRELLARIAGSISSAGLNILSADAYTRGDGLVFDLFRVCTTAHEAVTDERDWRGVEKRLATVLASDDYDFTQHLQRQLKRRSFHLSQELDFPTRISIDIDAHPTYTLIDVQTPDRLGLLYTLLRAIGSAGAQIALSRIATEKGAAIDSFYVTDLEGRKIKDAKTVARIQEALRDASQKPA
ncbi:MAG: [protein-PII] uridylyltransferase [Chthoniobacteraceae bacterium]